MCSLKTRYRNAHPKQEEGQRVSPWLQTAASSPSIASDIAFACRRGKTELSLFSIVGCIMFVLEMEDKAS